MIEGSTDLREKFRKPLIAMGTIRQMIPSNLHLPIRQVLSRQKSSVDSFEITNAYQRTTKLFRFIMQHKQTTKAVRRNQNQIELSETFPKKALDVGATSESSFSLARLERILPILIV
jgi:hypothetical protein